MEPSYNCPNDPSRRASKHCSASAYTDLLPANPVLKTDHNHCPEPVKVEVDICQTDMSICAAASNRPPARIYVLPKCLLPKMSGYRNVQLPKCPVTKMSVTKTSITKVSFTEMSGYRRNQQISALCVIWSHLSDEKLLFFKMWYWEVIHSHPCNLCILSLCIKQVVLCPKFTLQVDSDWSGPWPLFKYMLPTYLF